MCMKIIGYQYIKGEKSQINKISIVCGIGEGCECEGEKIEDV